MFLYSTSDLISLATNYLGGLWGFFEFLISLPYLFGLWWASLPAFFQVGVFLILTALLVVVILKLKTFILF